MLIDAKRLKEVAIPQQAIIKGDAKSASISAIIRKPSYLSSNIQSGSSNATSVSVANMGCRRLGNVDLRLMDERTVGLHETQPVQAEAMTR